MDGAVYRLGVALHKLDDPAKILGVCDRWILQPEDPWEVVGYVHNVVFTCGAVPEDDGTLEGETYNRPIGQDKPDPIRTWYQHKSFYLTCNRKIDDAILSPQFSDQIMKHFGMAAPLYHYIHRIASQVLSEQRREYSCDTDSEKFLRARQNRVSEQPRLSRLGRSVYGLWQLCSTCRAAWMPRTN